MYPARVFFRFVVTRAMTALLRRWPGQINPCADFRAQVSPALAEVPSRAHPPAWARPLAVRCTDRRDVPECEPKARPFRAGAIFARCWFPEERAEASKVHRWWALRFSRQARLRSQ